MQRKPARGPTKADEAAVCDEPTRETVSASSQSLAESATSTFPEIRLPPWILGFWVAFLIVGSLQPHRIRVLSQGHHGHAILHVLAFGVLGSLAMLTSLRRHRSLVFAGCLALGFLIELAQSHLYPNAIEWRDVRDDTVGVLLFSALTVVMLKLAGRRFQARST